MNEKDRSNLWDEFMDYVMAIIIVAALAVAVTTAREWPSEQPEIEESKP